MIAAKKEIQRSGLSIEVGFNAVVSFNPADLFWNTVRDKVTEDFIHSLDFVGLDFFPDVFSPLPKKPDSNQLSIEEASLAVLSHFRNVNLSKVNIPSTIPIHITENGWATSPSLSYERQAEVMMKTVTTIVENMSSLNITHYEYFALRDADSSGDAIQFGLLLDDYSPKPAFATFCDLIKRFGVECEVSGIRYEVSGMRYEV